MLSRLLVAILLTAVPLTGCIGNDDADEASLPVVDDVLGLLKPATDALWVNPQTAPHPLFNFPTLTHPAVGAAVPEWWLPIPALPLPDTITGLTHVAGTDRENGGGAGMSVFGSLAVVPGGSDGSAVYDIRDPASPKLLSTIEGAHRNVDFVAYPTGRLVAVFSTGSGTLPVWDITDPAAPVQLSEMTPSSCTHKVNIVPGTPIVYNANSAGGSGDCGLAGLVVQPRTQAMAEGQTEIFDLTDPENPVHVQDWGNGWGCHHIYFWNNAAENKFRALCAGIEVTQIWDIADPRNPEIIVNVPVHHGNPNLPSTSLSLESFSHFSILNQAGDILIVGDESGGGALPPGCTGHVEAADRSASGPLGALSFYDVSDEKNPRFLGWFEPTIPLQDNPPPVGGNPIGTLFYSCTAHHGRLVPAQGQEVLAMAFYRAGTVLVDFTDPTNPMQLDQFNDGTNTWEAQYYNGYVFTGDLSRGMDVLTLR